MMVFDAQFVAEKCVFDLDLLDIEDKIFDVEFDALQVVEISELPTYTGAYDVTPKWKAQALETNGLRMTGNVTVQEIPYYFVTNPHGGITVTIGG